VVYLKLYGIAFGVFLVIDLIWLGVIARNLYRQELGFIMSPKPNWLAAILFYIIFIMGLVFFVIHPAVEKSSLLSALFSGLLFGLVTYSTYDLTNLATLADWPLKITIIDMIWGTSLGGSVSVITSWIYMAWVK